VQLPASYVRHAVEQLRNTLQSGTKSQQKQFLRSFVRKIDYDYPRVTIFYSFPIQNRDGNDRCDGHGGSEDSRSMEEISIGGETVLATGRPGSPGRTRTHAIGGLES
jgi:hypothetical protein